MRKQPRPFYTHFHVDEHHFVDQAQDWIDVVKNHDEVKRTDFLDPRQAFILQTLANRESGVNCQFAGGHEQAERKRAWISSSANTAHFQTGLCVLSVKSTSTTWSSLQHRDFLGAILGLGIKREKIGDIHLHEQFCHYVIAEEISAFLASQLTHIQRCAVSTEVIGIDQLQVVSVTFREFRLSVASMRLDGIASDVYQLSRSQILTPLRAKKCRVNWRITEDPSYVLQEGDVISLQGFGRFTVFEISGISKKGRYQVRIGKHQ